MYLKTMSGKLTAGHFEFNGILLPKLFLPTVRKIVLVIFEITKTILSNSERSEQFLVTDFFFILFLEVSHI